MYFYNTFIFEMTSKFSSGTYVTCGVSLSLVSTKME